MFSRQKDVVRNVCGDLLHKPLPLPLPPSADAGYAG
jgi:hypothetical protein